MSEIIKQVSTVAGSYDSPESSFRNWINNDYVPDGQPYMTRQDLSDSDLTASLADAMSETSMKDKQPQRSSLGNL